MHKNKDFFPSVRTDKMISKRSLEENDETELRAAVSNNHQDLIFFLIHGAVHWQ